MSLYFLWNFLLTPYQEPFDVGSASSSDPIYIEAEQSSSQKSTVPSVPQATTKKGEEKNFVMTIYIFNGL